MMWIIAVITVFLWLLGFMSSHMMGGFIHILLVVAFIAVLIGISTDRRSISQSK
ncbi:MAG: lmo0937 family membrane protein [Desulfobulbaceae bacterium]|nr:MAG: lmo0937 family membrane protein [Desulfobulbaceae bacterium]